MKGRSNHFVPAVLTLPLALRGTVTKWLGTEREELTIALSIHTWVVAKMFDVLVLGRRSQLAGFGPLFNVAAYHIVTYMTAVRCEVSCTSAAVFVHGRKHFGLS